MKRKVFYAFFILALGLGLPGGVPASSQASELLVPASPQIDLGEPGMSFAYDQTYGVTEVPYLADTDHLYGPVGVGVDATGNLWAVEREGTRAMKYTGNGAFLMAIGTPGLTLLADETHFSLPTDATEDSAGNIWIADCASHRVVQFDPGGTYLTQLGVTWESGTDNAHFTCPVSVAFDSADNLYVSDQDAHRIQIFDSSLVYSATLGVPGEPGSGNDHFNAPYHIAIDSDDYLYVPDVNNHRLQIFDADHNYVDTLGVPGEPGSDNDHFNGPHGVALDATRIFIPDAYNGRVQVFDRATYAYLTTLGGWGSPDEFDIPTDVATDQTGNLYVADLNNHRVQKYNNNLVYARTFGTTGVPYLTDGEHYNQPFDVAVDAWGNIGIIEDWGRGQRFIQLDASGVPQFTIGEPGVAGSDNDHLFDPRGVAYDALGNIYIADCANHRIQIFDSTGVYSDTLGSGPGQGNDEFDCPSGVAFDSSGNLYVADATNQRVQIFDSNLVYSDSLGVTGESGSDNDHFNWPQDVSVGVDGSIYVVDTFNQRVQGFDSNLVWQMTLGTTGECGSDFDHFCEPMGVALDAAGNIYVVEKFGPRVQVFDPAGAYLTTIGGSWGSLNGQLREPYGVEVDTQGNVYIADTVNHRIQRFHPGVPGWTQLNLNGFGNRWVDQIPSLEVFNETLYAGTSNYSEGLHHIFFTADGHNWQEGSHEFEGGVSALQSFKGFLYAGTWNGLVWRSEDGINWSNVFTSTQGFASFSVLNNKLYAGTYYDEGTTIYQTTDGLIWTPFVTGGNGDPDADGTISSAIFKNMLYFGVADWSGTGGGRIWRTDGTDVTEVVSDGFGDPLNITPGGLTSFGDRLYASISNLDSFQVWRSDSGDEDSWEMVFEYGQGTPGIKDRTGLIVYNSQLFLTAQNDWSGLTVWRTIDGLDWQQIGFGGFGDSNNIWTEWGSSLATFAGRLYIGVNNGGNGVEVWTYAPNILWLPLITR